VTLLVTLLNKVMRDYIPLCVIAGIVIALDQWTKFLVRTNLALGEIWMPLDWLAPYARIINWKNTGAAFGMLKNFGGVFSVLAIIVSAAILYFYPQVPRQDKLLRLALGMQLAGALGNLIDRLVIGSVTDFISVGTFPVFNVADSSISVGVVVLIGDMWLRERRQKRAASLNGEQAQRETTPPSSPAPEGERE
jgi:signal peptidase II